MITTIEGGITAPAGFRAAGVHCGIKASADKLDLALVVSDQPATAAAVFTTNLAVAPPIVVSRDHLESSRGSARAVVVNSGCANACTGEQGRQVAHLMAAETARAVDCELEEVLVMSTGVIGVQLDPRTVAQGIIAAADELSVDGHMRAARAISKPMTLTQPMISTSSTPAHNRPAASASWVVMPRNCISRAGYTLAGCPIPALRSGYTRSAAAPKAVTAN